ncbi:hypothetical protein [Neptunicella sp. SCSIO 80796]|uniref:hypothetical protein n=1 Tax=Neptunicella plasticusilytica TaxID=3117012 RepID=UPI003A4D7216
MSSNPINIKALLDAQKADILAQVDAKATETQAAVATEADNVETVVTDAAADTQGNTGDNAAATAAAVIASVESESTNIQSLVASESDSVKSDILNLKSDLEGSLQSQSVNLKTQQSLIESTGEARLFYSTLTSEVDVDALNLPTSSGTIKKIITARNHHIKVWADGELIIDIVGTGSDTEKIIVDAADSQRLSEIKWSESILIRVKKTAGTGNVIMSMFGEVNL